MYIIIHGTSQEPDDNYVKMYTRILNKIHIIKSSIIMYFSRLVAANYLAHVYKNETD